MDMYNAWVAVRRRIATSCLRLRGVKIGKNSIVGLRVDIPFNPAQVEVGEGCFISDGCTFYCNNHNGKIARIIIGNDVVINKNVVIDCAEMVVIEEGARIGPNAFITDHGYDSKAGIPLKMTGIIAAPVHIGKNVYIGANSVLAGKILIPENAVITAAPKTIN